MDFIYTWGLWLGVTDMSGRSLKCFSKCAQRTPCVSIALFGNNSNSQAALEWPPGSDLWGWSLGLCILPPPLVTLIHSRAIGTLVMGGWVGGAWRGADPRGRKHQGEEREGPGQRKVLTTSSHPSCFSHGSPHNLAWPHPWELAAGRSCQNGARVPSCRPSGSRGLPCRKKDPSQGAVGAKGLWAPGGTAPTWGVRLKPLSRSLGRETSGSCWDTGGAGTDCAVPLGLRVICQLGVEWLEQFP